MLCTEMADPARPMDPEVKGVFLNSAEDASNSTHQTLEQDAEEDDDVQ